MVRAVVARDHGSPEYRGIIAFCINIAFLVSALPLLRGGSIAWTSDL